MKGNVQEYAKVAMGKPLSHFARRWLRCEGDQQWNLSMQGR